MSILGAKLILEALELIKNDKAKFIEQKIRGNLCKKNQKV